MRQRPKYTAGMNEIRRLLDNIGRIDKDSGVDKDLMVWFILTALRGPDNSNDHVKSYTTARLRHKFFRKLSGSCGADCYEGELHPINHSHDVPGHFIQHWNLAIEYMEILEKQLKKIRLIDLTNRRGR